MELSQSVGEIVGPGLAGALVQVLSAPLAMLVDAFSFLVSALTLAWIRAPEPSLRSEKSSLGIVRAIAEGLRFVIGEPLLRTIISSYAMLVFFNSVLEAVFILYLTTEVGITPFLLGIIFAISSIGFVLGALFAAWLTRHVGIGMTLFITPLIIGESDMLIPLAGLIPHLAFPLVGLAQFFFGLARPVLSINQVSLRQAITPERLQGRMNATVSFVVFGLPTLAALLGGTLGQFLRLPETLVIAAIGEMLACVDCLFAGENFARSAGNVTGSLKTKLFDSLLLLLGALFP